MKRVVITGVGVISSIGNEDKNSSPSFWENIKAGKHGISTIEGFDTTALGVSVAAQIKDFDPLVYFDKKELRRTDRYSQFAVGSAIQAIDDCGTDFSDIDPYRIGVIYGSGIGGLSTIEQEHNKFLEKGAKRVSVYFIPMMISNMAAGLISIKYGFKGPNYAPVTACATSSHALGEAFRLIKGGYADACIAGGSEASITEFAMAGFKNMQALSTQSDPDKASIPFDLNRDGFVIAEGGATLVLEELEHALARNAKIYAEIVGYGCTSDAYHITSPDPNGEGSAKAMELAMLEANVSPADVDYLNAHGTSTPLNDKYETVAIKKAFGEHANNLMISSTKSMTGHLLGAAGAVEGIVCAKAIYEGVVPPTVGFTTPDPECDLDYVTDGLREKQIEVALSNSLGFGGHNACVCFRRYK